MNTQQDKARSKCGVRFLRSAQRQGLFLSVAEVARIEQRLARLQPCFERPGTHRYELTLRISRRRVPVVYDTELRCLVSMSGGRR